MADSEASVCSHFHLSRVFHIDVSAAAECMYRDVPIDKWRNRKGNQIHAPNKDIAGRVTQEGWLHVQSMNVSCSHMHMGIKSHNYQDTREHLCMSPRLCEDLECGTLEPLPLLYANG